MHRPYLDERTLETLKRVIMESEIYVGRRGLAVKSLPVHIVHELDGFSRPIDQLHSDLVALSVWPALDDGRIPLVLWLESIADMIAPKPDCALVREYVKRITLEQTVIPSASDERHFLIWQRHGHGAYRTTWLTAPHGQVEAMAAQRPGLLLATGSRFWRTERVPIHIWKQTYPAMANPAEAVRLLETVKALRLYDLVSGSCLPVDSRSWGALQPQSLSDDFLPMELHRDEAVVSILGKYCVYRSRVYDWRGQNCAHDDVRGSIFDLEASTECDLLVEVEAWLRSQKGFMDRVREQFRREGQDMMAMSGQHRSPSQVSGRIGGLFNRLFGVTALASAPVRGVPPELQLTEIEFKFTYDGALRLGCQFTGEAECHAVTDGSWGCFRRSVYIESEAPPSLLPYAQMPEPVRLWFQRYPDDVIGWAALPNTHVVRETLKSVLGPVRAESLIAAAEL